MDIEDVICISSDDELPVQRRTRRRPPSDELRSPSKKLKAELPIEILEDDDSDCALYQPDDDSDSNLYMASLDLNNEKNWKPYTVDDVVIPDSITTSPSTAQPSYRGLRPKPFKPRLHELTQHELENINHDNTPRLWSPQTFDPVLRDVVGRRRVNPDTPKRTVEGLASGLGYDKLALFSKYQRCSGWVHAIAQAPGSVAVGTVTADGDAEEDVHARGKISWSPTVPGPYNRDENLIVWQGRKGYNVEAHDVTWKSSGVEHRKFYHVNGVAFCPVHTDILVSIGNDRTVRYHQVPQPGEPIQLVHTLNYQSVPREIAFQPGSSVLAVSSSEGFIYLHPKLYDTHECRLLVAENENETAGAFLWGKDNMIYASTEGIPDTIQCTHKAFDVSTQVVTIKFDTRSSGDSMALHDNSGRLALVTGVSSGGKAGHHLRLYDVNRRNGKSLYEGRLNNPHPGFDLEIHEASFSHDGTYLALARNDHVAHVYDTRFLRSNPLPVFTCSHLPPPNSATDCSTYLRPNAAQSLSNHADSSQDFNLIMEEFGVVSVKWVTGRSGLGLGLITAGSDCRVRLWDIGDGDDLTGLVIAEMDYGITALSVGDLSLGEHRLVVGDSGGVVHVYD